MEEAKSGKTTKVYLEDFKKQAIFLIYQLEQTGRFKKDIKLAKKRGLNMQLLDEVPFSCDTK